MFVIESGTGRQLRISRLAIVELAPSKIKQLVISFSFVRGQAGTSLCEKGSLVLSVSTVLMTVI